MSLLRKLPLDRLKLDMSFISRMSESPEDHAVVSAIVALARSLRLTTVAEGIETEPQFKSLRDMDCVLGQGYLCSKPLPLAQVYLTICAGFKHPIPPHASAGCATASLISGRSWWNSGLPRELEAV